MSQNTYKVAFIGCGRRAHQSAGGVQADPRCHVVGLADISEEATTRLKETFGFPGRAYTDHRQMLEKEKPDVVVSSLWTDLHLPVYRDCVERGVKVVMSEKPMAPSWADCREMGRIADESGVLLTFCHQRRYAPGNLLARKLIEDGTFGELLRMDLYSPCDMLDCGTHTFDQAMSFNRETPAKWVMGAVDASAIKAHFGLNSEEMSTAHVVFANGVRTHIQAKGPDRDMPTGLRIYGDNGMLEVGWDGQFGKAVVFSDSSWKPPAIPQAEEGQVMRDVTRDTLDCFEKGMEPPLSHQKALRTAEIIYAIYESAASRRRIELPLTIDDHPLDRIAEEYGRSVRVK